MSVARRRPADGPNPATTRRQGASATPLRPAAVPRTPVRAAGRPAGTLTTVRVRLLELRLLAVLLAVLWALVAAFLLGGYRPGGPADLLVGLAALVPLGVSLAAVAWPPAARGGIAFRSIAALAVGTILVLLPTLASLVGQLVGQGLQTLLPSLEAAYPWALAILGTSFFAGLGIARRALGPTSGRPGRLGAAVAVGAGLAIFSGSALAGAAVANELALQDRPATASRYGPTDPLLVPPTCDGALAAGSTAQLTLDLGGSVDGRSLGIARARGARARTDFRWLADVTTIREVGLAGVAALGSGGWIRDVGGRWSAEPVADVAGESLDLALVGTALVPSQRTAAEDLGLAYVEGARARRCRVAVDGTAFRAAFPQVRWLVGDADLRTWRGQIDAWVFADGELGLAEGTLGGPGFAITPGAIRAELTATLTATHRGAPVTILAPTN